MVEFAGKNPISIRRGLHDSTSLNPIFVAILWHGRGFQINLASRGNNSYEYDKVPGLKLKMRDRHA